MPDLFPVKPFHIRYGSPHKPPRKNSVKGLHRKRRFLLTRPIFPALCAATDATD